MCKVLLHTLKNESLRSVLALSLFTDEKTQVWVSAHSGLRFTLFCHNCYTKVSSYRSRAGGEHGQFWAEDVTEADSRRATTGFGFLRELRSLPQPRFSLRSSKDNHHSHTAVSWRIPRNNVQKALRTVLGTLKTQKSTLFSLGQATERQRHSLDRTQIIPPGVCTGA